MHRAALGLRCGCYASRMRIPCLRRLPRLFSMCAGCHSSYVEATLQNHTAQPISLVELDYPSASFGVHRWRRTPSTTTGSRCWAVEM